MRHKHIQRNKERKRRSRRVERDTLRYREKEIRERGRGMKESRG